MNQKNNQHRKHSTITPRMLAVSGIVIAAYIVVMYLMQGVSFGQYQMRLATSMYALAAIHPFLILPLGLSNLLSNTLLGGLGPLDIIGGFGVGILTSSGCFYLRKISFWLVGLPILVLPTVLVPIWLSYLLHVPYLALVVSVGVGQTAPAIMSVLLVRYLEKPLLKLQEVRK